MPEIEGPVALKRLRGLGRSLTTWRNEVSEQILRGSNLERRPRWLRYGMAAASVALAVLAQLRLQPILDTDLAFSLFFPAIMLSAWFGGLGPGLFATALSTLASWSFFAWPFFSLALHPGEPLRLSLFVGSGLVICFLSEALHNARRRIASAASEAMRRTREEASLVSQIQAQRSRLDALVSNVPGVVWEAWGVPDNRAQRIDFVSDYAETLLGYTVQDWLSTPNLWLTLVHPDDKERAAREAAAIFAGGRGGVSAFRWVAKDGRVIPVEAQSTVICDEAGRPVGMRGVTLDITERRKAEEAVRFLSEASRALGSSLDYEKTLKTLAFLAVPHIADWCVVDILEDGRLRRVAVAHDDPAKVALAHKLENRYPIRLDPDYGVGKALRTGWPELIPEIPDALLARAARDPQHLRILKELGLRSSIIVPLRAPQRRNLGIITLVMAESGRVYTQQDLALAESLADRAAAAVDNARLYREAQEANRLKDEFLATLSHELRTPLNAILGWAGLLKSGKLDEETSSRAVETIERNAKVQTQLIADVLDVSRIVAGKLRLEVAAVDIASVVEAALDTVRPSADAKGIRLEAILDPGAGPVSGDAGRLQQVVWNLLSNAIKFTPKEGRVQVRVARLNSNVEVRVADTGIGIAPEFLPHVFEQFRQADSSSTRAHSGLGLGLAIVRHLVELHGGTVQVESAGQGQGAVFTVKLPVMIVRLRPSTRAEGSPPSGAPHPEAASPGTSPALLGVHVLVIDDEEEARSVISTILESEGALVTSVASGDEGFAALTERRPDVLVSDIEMPGQDGYALLRRVRALGREQGGGVPAAALTAYARDEDRLQAFLAGFQIHLAKPVDPRELVAVVANLARRVRPAPDPSA